MYHVRFHLARGKNYLKWQIKNTKTEDVRYYDPELYQLIMTNCKLINYKPIANRIYEGANKDVCAWISCSSVIPLTNIDKEREEENQICYNPRVAPYWTNHDYSENIDGMQFIYLVTKGRKLFKLQYNEDINRVKRDIYAEEEIP